MLLKIITADGTLKRWESLGRKLSRIRRALESIQNVGEVKIEIIEDQSLVPEVLNGRVTHYWMEKLSSKYKENDSFVVFHMSLSQHRRWGIKPTLRGVAFNDSNMVSEAYFWSNENTKRNGYSQFEETLLHELSHLLYHRSGGRDITHEWHDKHRTIVGLFKHHNYTKYQVGVLSKILNWLRDYVKK